MKIPPSGYAWWYFDAISDDGKNALTAIVFIGSVFSPYYRRRWRRGESNPADHCAINLALYGSGANAWCMTERAANSVVTETEGSTNTLHVGPSSLKFGKNFAKIEIYEYGAPLPRTIRGSLEFRFEQQPQEFFSLDDLGNHYWRPVASRADVEVTMEKPRVNWTGSAYLDMNYGHRPLEKDFQFWSWSRCHIGSDTIIHYDVDQTNGKNNCLALGVNHIGELRTVPVPPRANLKRTGWRIARPTRSEDGHAAVVKTLEDTPFYSRTQYRTRLSNKTAVGIHESLDLKRFSHATTQFMLGFRMPRNPRAKGQR